MLKIRASSVGYIMTDPRSKSDKESGILAETVKTHLIDCFVSEHYGRNSDMYNKYIVKGLAVEEDAITLYSMQSKKLFFKNEETLENEWIKGTPDLYEGDTIQTATKIIDIKSSFDLYTFMRAKYSKDLNKNYYYQLQSYMALTGAKEAELVYCLVNTPLQMIQDEQRRLQWKMNVLDNDEALEEGFAEIEHNMTYDDIPAKDRIFKIPVQRDEVVIESIYNRVRQCRKYYNETFLKLSPVSIAEYDQSLKTTIVN